MTGQIASSRPLKIAKVFTDIAWWVFVVGGVLIVIGLLFSITGRPFAFGQSVRVDIRAANDNSWSLESGPAGQVEPKLDKVQGELALQSAPPKVRITTAIFLAVGLSMMLYGISLFRGLLRDVIAQKIFTDENATRLSRLGWLMIAGGILGPASNEKLASMILGQMRSSVFLLTPADEGSGYPLVIGLVTLVMAAIWRYGVDLQRDRDSTV